MILVMTFFGIDQLKLIPGHTYRVSYWARGSAGYVRTFLYGWSDKDTGLYVDGQHVVKLSPSRQRISYDVKYNQLSDDTRNFAFRPGNSDKDSSLSSGEATDFSVIDVTNNNN